MKYYEKLIDFGCFNKEQIVQLTGSEAAASSLLYDYQKKGYIERVRRNFYAVISLETKQPLYSRYQLGSHIAEDACISHHSAFEVYGYANQVFYEVYVATNLRFEKFEYDGIWYQKIERKKNIDMIQNGQIRITGIEQTVVDSIRDFEKIAGIEEVLRCILLIPDLKEEKLLEALERYQNGFLYQKCGYIFEQLRDRFSLSDNFFVECERHIATTKRYLRKEYKDTKWHEKWHLYAPKQLENLVNKGVNNYDAV
ncbi:MAG: transcriptional regulator [Lachnospiraceae bacterium]|nr:transcriptional regulator [Lachnospiraceae bacterium]